MNQSRFKRYGTVLIAIILSLSLVIPVFAVDKASISNNVIDKSIGKINLSGKSYIELKEVNILPSEAGKTVTYTFSIHNGEVTDLSFIDYWVRLRTKAGARLTSSLIAEDQDKTKVPALSSQEYTFYATVNASIELKDLALEFIQWDFSAYNYERRLGEIRVPDNYTNVIPAQSFKNIVIQNSVVKTGVERMEIRETDEFHKTTIYYDIENTGLRSVTIPGFTFYLRTAQGLMYALKAEDLDDAPIQPRVKKTVKLSADIPVEIEQKDWQLLVIQDGGTSSVEIPKGFYQLPDPTTKTETLPDGVAMGQEQEVTIDDKLYGLTLNSIQRLPWNDEDIISAEITLNNLNDESLPLPNINGYFNLDGVKLDEASTVTVHLDNILGLPANSKTTFIMYVKIPYTYEYDKVDLVVVNKAVDKEEDDDKLVTFNHDSKSLALSVVKEGEVFEIKNLGKRAGISIREVMTYKDTSSNIFYVEVEMENLEKRQTELAKLTGYLKTEDDVYFPVTITEVKTRISPNGKALMSFWTSLPKKYETNHLQLVIGEEIAEGDDQAFIQVAAYDLPVEKVMKPRVEFDAIKIYPYEVSITNMKVSLSTNATVNFDYTASKVNEYEVIPDGHKLVIELVDGDIAYAQEYEFETELKMGSHQGEMIANMHIGNVLDKMQSIDGFEFRIYDSFEGHKKLLASKMIYRITSGF